jgi:hypothetical protein
LLDSAAVALEADDHNHRHRPPQPIIASEITASIQH